MAFDLYAVQKDIKTMLETTFPEFLFYRNTMPEDEQIPRQGTEVNPFFLLQWGPLYDNIRGKSIRGARNDEYSSWVQVVSIGSVEEDAASALSLIVDRLLGYRPVGATGLIPKGGPTDYGSRQYSVRPVLYYQSQRFDFNITQTGLDGHLTS